MGKGPRTLACTSCGAPVSFQTPFCSYCRAALTWHEVPSLHRGDAQRLLDLSRDALPGAEGITAVRRSDGLLVDVPSNRAHMEHFGSPARDVSVSLSGVCLDASGALGVIARVNPLAGAKVGYMLQIRPGFRTYWVARFLSTQDELHVEALRNWEAVREVAGVGAVNQIELRVADSVLAVAINGVDVATIVDARFGIGCVGWRASSFDKATKVLLRTLEVRHVS